MTRATPPRRARQRVLVGVTVVIIALSVAGCSDSAVYEGREDVAQVFRANCAGCHGADGSGAAGPAIGDGVTKDKSSAEEMQQHVRSGIGLMPRFDLRLSDEQIVDVVEFVRNDLTIGEDVPPFVRPERPLTTAP